MLSYTSWTSAHAPTDAGRIFDLYLQDDCQMTGMETWADPNQQGHVKSKLNRLA